MTGGEPVIFYDKRPAVLVYVPVNPLFAVADAEVVAKGAVPMLLVAFFNDARLALAVRNAGRETAMR